MSRTALCQQSHRNQGFVGSQQKMSRRVELNSRKRQVSRQKTAGRTFQEWDDRDGIHVYVWLSPFTVHLKLSQHCKLALLLLSRFSRVRLCATPWTAAHQTSPSMGFSRQEYWSGVPSPSPKLAIPQYKMFLVLKKLKIKKKRPFNILFNWLHCIVTYWYFYTFSKTSYIDGFVPFVPLGNRGI